MRAPYGLNILDNCVSCPVRGEHLFCNLSLPAAQRLNEVKSTAVYPGAMLLIEGQQPRGVFVLCVGKGEIFYFFARRQDHYYEDFRLGRCSRAEWRGVEPALRSDRRDDGTRPGQFHSARFPVTHLKDFPEVAVAQRLSRNYYTAYAEIRTLGLAVSPSEKFAKLLLSWTTKSAQDDGSAQVKLTLTHEEVAEIIGTTRETVRRLFSEFKKKQFLQMKGATLVIRSRFALEKIASPDGCRLVLIWPRSGR
jgi:CRP/FNR family transcriptional regulator, cyclic AMP receptor protein